MKNISLNFESLNSPDGGISRVANLVLRFFEDRSKLNNDKIFLNIFYIIPLELLSIKLTIVNISFFKVKSDLIFSNACEVL